MPQASRVPDRIFHQPYSSRSFTYEASYYSLLANIPRTVKTVRVGRCTKYFQSLSCMIRYVFFILFVNSVILISHLVIKRGTSNSGMEGES